MYLDHSTPDDPKVVSAPDPKAGLWIQPRAKDSIPIKISIPVDCLGTYPISSLATLDRF